MSIQDDMLAALTPMLNPAAFGVEATYKGGPVNVIFQKPTQEWSPLENRMITTSPMATGLATDFAAWAAADTIIINTVTYRIPERPVPDEVGLVAMVLAK